MNPFLTARHHMTVIWSPPPSRILKKATLKTLTEIKLTVIIPVHGIGKIFKFNFAVNFNIWSVIFKWCLLFTISRSLRMLSERILKKDHFFAIWLKTRECSWFFFSVIDSYNAEKPKNIFRNNKTVTLQYGLNWKMTNFRTLKLILGHC